MVSFGRAGTRQTGSPPGFAPVLNQDQGNNYPGDSGLWIPDPTPMGPGRNATGGNLGGDDGNFGADPRAAKIQPNPRVWRPQPNGGTDLGLGGEPTRNEASQGVSGIWTSILQVFDRHAYWDTGYQRTGVSPSVPGNPPNQNTDGPPPPELRTVNRTLSFQIGSDATSAQDDLSRNYTWLGEQGSGWAPVYGGLPGLYQPYGTRGGVPYPIVAPVAQGDQGDGPHRVFAGPPHGLHSVTIASRWQTNQRYSSTPQMRPVRADRPSNSPQAGQSYSQTVQHQGATGPTGTGQGAQVSSRLGNRRTLK